MTVIETPMEKRMTNKENFLFERLSPTGIDINILKRRSMMKVENQWGRDFSVLLSSAGDSFPQFRFAEEKGWDDETSCPKQNSALYMDSESLVRVLQLPLAVQLNVASELIQIFRILELPWVKPRKNDNGKELRMQLRGPISELRSAEGGCPRSLRRDSLRQTPLDGLQKASFPPQSVADHPEELDNVTTLRCTCKKRKTVSLQTRYLRTSNQKEMSR